MGLTGFSETSKVRYNSKLYLLTVLERVDDHLPALHRNKLKTHSASSSLYLVD